MGGPEGTPARRERRWRAVVALLFVVGLGWPLRAALVGDRVLSQADQLLAWPPWSEVAPPGHRPANPLLEDQSILMVPWLEFAASRVRAGELPLWNPYSYAGQPIHAANSGAFLWPLHLVYYAFPTHRFWAWSALARLGVAALGAGLWLRRLGVSRAAAPAGAAAFALSGFLVVWLNHPHANVACLLPLLLWVIERAAARPGARAAGLAALVLGAMLVGGHLQTALHVLLLAGAYAAFRALVPVGGARLGGRGLASLAAGGAVAGLLAAAQLLPFAAYLAESQGVRVLEAAEQTDPLAPLDGAVTLVAPDAHGRPDRGDYDGPLGRNLNYSELVGGFVGRLALALAALAVVLRPRDRRVWFLAGAALVAALVAWHVPPFHDLFRRVPRVRSTNPMRLLLVTATGLAALAALGLDAALARLRVAGRTARTVGLGVAALVLAELAAWADGYNPTIPRELVFPPTPTTDFLREHAGLHRAEGTTATTLRASANLPYRIPTLTGYDKLEYRPLVELGMLLTERPPEVPFLSEVGAFDRLEALPLASLLGVRYLVGTEPLPPPLELAFASPGGVLVHENTGVLPRAFPARGYAVEPDPAARLARLGAAELDPWTAVLHAAPSGDLARRAVAAADGTAPGEVRIARYEPREVELEADLARPALVVLSDAWDRGWEATVDGARRPVERVDHALRGVWVDAGRHRVALRYRPAAARLGLLLSGLGAGAAVLLLVLGDRGGAARRPPRPIGEA